MATRHQPRTARVQRKERRMRKARARMGSGSMRRRGRRTLRRKKRVG
jgi:hypothetical protein